MDDRFMDCPWRERAQWLGDAKVEAYGAQYCFGDTLLLRRMLRQMAEMQHPDGRIDPVGPGDWESFNANLPIPGFMAIWIHCVSDYYLLTGDKELPTLVMPAIEKAIGWFETFVNADGMVENITGWNFVDWAPGLSGGNTGLRASLNLQYLQALRTAAEMAKTIGDSEKSARFAGMAARLTLAIHDAFWDEARGLYKDHVPTGDDEDPPANNYSQQANSLALLYEIGTAKQRHRVLAALTEDDTLTQIASPYFGYYLLAALYKYGQHDRALAYIRKHWGHMLDAGATSWWEKFDGHGSRCHAWSCGPTIDLQAQILGVTPETAGFKTVRIAPHPCDIAWAKGIVPIPQGEIMVSWQKTADGGFILDVTSPSRVRLRPVLPEIPEGMTVTVNDEPVQGNKLGTLPGGGYRIAVARPLA
jgi:alpha-L-rhamnosidase